MPLVKEILPEDAPRLKELKHRQRVLRARKLVTAFASFVFGWKLQKFQEHWHEFADKYKRALIFAPQAHGKTVNMSLIRPLFVLGRNPNRILKIISCNDDKAVDILGAIAKTIESNKKFHEVFPSLKPAERGSWTKHQITVKRDVPAIDASVEALGVLSTGSGDRATDLMFDDPVDFRNAILQPALRKMVIRAYTATWLGLFAQGEERITYICNAWHHNDLTHEIKKPNYHYHILNQAIAKVKIAD
ncbi:unnamed protein product [marine sediment metagenome]|uniref:Terminase large subunit gp17-like C-terminal domain-containing protein n=1 Tax=marine sediment metagenome TaxID=412755 RepID=X1EM32_9ZZZZ